MSVAILLCAVARASSVAFALGIKTSFQKLAVVGWKSVILMVAETLFLQGVVLICLYTGIADW